MTSCLGTRSRGGNPRSTVTDVNRMREQVEQLRREAKYMKGIESRLQWDMQREQSNRQRAANKNDDKDLLKWRQDLAKGMIADEQEKVQAMKQDDLQCSREFQEHKRFTKKAEETEDLERTREEYDNNKEHSEWHIETRKLREQELRTRDLEENLEKRKLIADKRLKETQEDEMEQQWRRNAREQSDVEHVLMQARHERDLALQSLEFVRAHQVGPRRYE